MINYPDGIRKDELDRIFYNKEYKLKIDNRIEATNKYHNKKVIIDDIKFDSKKEANRYIELKHFEQEGMISNLERQVKIEIQPRFSYNGKIIRPIYYVADFAYKDTKTGNTIYEDTKGFKTDIYKLKYKLLLFKGIEIKEL